MILHRSEDETTETTSPEDYEDAVKPTTESEQASTSTEANQNLMTRIRNWLDRNKDALMAAGIVASLTGQTYTLVRS